MRKSAPLIHVRELSITHVGADRPSPKQVSFDVHPGEVVLLLGPSGSGKSTLTLALNGLIPQAVPARVTGKVEVSGQDAATRSVAELSQSVAMVFQDPDAQLVTGTVLDEVSFALENLLLPVEEILERAERALRQVGLWERRTENPDRLSGGGRQRLAIACALAMASPVIVLDEPTANLDPVGIDEVYAALGNLVASSERAIVLVEHNLDAAMNFATRAVVLDAEGAVLHDGPVRDVILGHTEELLRLGVWLPNATLAALELRDAGFGFNPLPLTPAELSQAVTAATKKSGASIAGRSTPDATERTGEPLITARGLTVQKSRHVILHDIDLDIEAGSFTAFVGTNGAGKTTLIQALAGVVAPPKHKVQIDGLDPAKASPRELSRRIGFVFQNPEHQFIAHTVFDELAHGLRLQKLPETEIEEQVTAMLSRFGLEDKAHVHPFLLSGGQKRRLSVGTELITQPRVLVLDEPTFGQDRSRASELMSLLQEVQREGTTVLVVTHDLQLVADYATHTVVLKDGRIHAAGATAEIFADDEVFETAGLRLPAVFRALPPELRRIGSGARA